MFNFEMFINFMIFLKSFKTDVSKNLSATNNYVTSYKRVLTERVILFNLHFDKVHRRLVG